jgi:hypothetical protein
MSGGLITANFMDGAMKGASFVQGMQDRQEASTLRQAAGQRAQESHDASQQVRAVQLQQMNDAHAEKMNKTLAWSMHSSANAPKEYQDFIRAHPNLDAKRLLSDDYGKAIQTAHDALDGKISYDHPDVSKAFDTLLPEVQAGATQGRKVSTSRLYPGNTPGTLMVGLRVEGDPQERPLTVGRGAEPDAPVKEIHVDDLIARVDTAAKYRQYLQTPEGSKAFIDQHIGADIAKMVREQSKETRESALTKARTDAENARAAKYNHEAQKPYGNGADGKKSALELQVDLLTSEQFGMSPKQALDYLKTKSSDPAKDLQLLAQVISKNGEVEMEDTKDKDDKTIPGAISRAVAARKLIEKAVADKKNPPAPDDNPPPAGNQNTGRPSYDEAFKRIRQANPNASDSEIHEYLKGGAK